MFSIAVIEDSKDDAEQIMGHIEKYGKEHDVTFSSVLWSEAESFINQYRPKYDIIFFDIELPGVNGMEAAKRIREMDAGVTIVFTTYLSRYAVKSYEVEAFDYIVKPVSYAAFLLKMRRIVSHVENVHDQTIVISGKKGIQRMLLSRLSYIEVQNHDILFHTEDGIIEGRGTLKELEEQLTPCHFLRCNNCYLVNLRHIRAVNDNMVVLVGGEQLPISRPKKREFIDGFTQYLGDV